MKVILSINAGSSSVKISVYSADKGKSPQQIAECQVSGLTAPPAQLTYTRGDTSVIKKKDADKDVNSQDDAFKLLLKTLIDDDQLSEIKQREDIAIACHRIVHGGDYAESKIIDKSTYHHLEQLSDLAPLHNGAALTIVESCLKELPGATNVACFDSQFHATIPRHIATYPIDQEVARKNHLRKYGFHGISYAFITRSVAEFLGKDASELNIIALHLGSGASACAIKGGKSWDTSMGLTPLAGLPGATRSGSVDPSLVFHYASDVGKLSPSSTSHLHISKAEEILNKQSGWKSLTGTTDFGTITSSLSSSSSTDNDSDKQDPHNHRLAFDLFVDRVCGFVGSYYVSLGGQVDALVFAGGIGEKSGLLRDAVVSRARCLGFPTLDAERNAKEVTDVVTDISSSGSGSAGDGGVGGGGGKGKEVAAGHRVLICQTDEQFEMARVCAMREDLWS